MNIPHTPSDFRDAEPLALEPSARVTWPDGFAMGKRGLSYAKGDGDPALVCGHFEVLGQSRDADGATQGLMLRWHDGERVQVARISRSELAGDGAQWAGRLADRGFPVPHNRGRRGWLAQALLDVETDARVLTVTRTGWHGDAFVLPARTIGDKNGERVLYFGQRSGALYREAGTLDDWKVGVAAPAAGNSRVVLALSMAFAGALADWLEEEPGGFHFVGPSSCGKSTALYAAGSVWGGGGRSGFTHTWRATENGLESLAKAHSGTVLPLDELGELDGRAAYAVAYGLLNGQGKVRANREGEARERTSWRCMLLSTGEVTLADKIAEGGRLLRAGQAVRIVDVPADAGAGLGLFEATGARLPQAFAEALKAAAFATFGTAGPAFVAWLSERPGRRDDTAARIAILRDLVAGPNADPQTARVARAFALAAVAGDMASVALGLPWRVGEAEAAARKCFEAWRASRGGDGPGEVLAARAALRAQIDKHADARFVRLDDAGRRERPDVMLRDMLGYSFRHGGEAHFGFTATGWAETLRGVGHPTHLARALAACGVLAVSPSQAGEGRFQLAKRVERETKRLFAVRAAALSEGEL